MQKRSLASLAAAAVLLTFTAHGLAQQADGTQVSVSYERTRDRFHYRFENPSTFDTVALVPHEFTQTYWGDNQWLVVRARYRRFETEAAATPSRATRGDDFDTFFQPSGDVVVSGTTGGISMKSWRVRQSMGIGRRTGMDWAIAYGYRSDRSDFHPGLKSISHTQPPAYESFMVFTREMTTSRNYGADIAVARTWRQGRWRITAEGRAAPIANGRLSIELPDKYPGRTLVFNAIFASVEPAVTVAAGDRWPVAIRIGYARTFGYAGSRQFLRSAATIGASVGWRARQP
jgi:hypothetical protein